MTAWDDLLSMIDRYLRSGVPDDAEHHLLPVVERAQRERSIDRELRSDDVARWIVCLVLGHDALRQRHRDVPAELDHSDLRLVLTRWLHPARPRV